MEAAHKKSKKLLFSSAKMAIATLISRLLGLFREQLMALYFGASGVTDAFLIAYRIPNLFRDLLAEGAFSAAFVPNFIESLKKDKDEAKKLLWASFTFLFCLSGFISLCLMGGARYFVEFFIDQKMVLNTEWVELASTMLQIMSFYLLFVSLAALFMGALNSVKMFFIPALAPVVFNISMIMAMIFFPKFLEKMGLPGIYALAWGVLLGGAAQFLLQLPFILKKGFNFTRHFRVFHTQTKKVLIALGPGLIGFAATQVNILINSVLATSTLIGAVSWLNYSFRLFQMPVGVVGVSLGNAHLVHFSDAWKQGDKTSALEILRMSSFYSMSLVLPPMIALLVIGDWIVEIIFQRGAFGADATIQTALALGAYSLGLPFYALSKVYTPSFYTLEKPSIAALCSVFSIVVNIVFSLLFIDQWGFVTLAWATTLSLFVNALSKFLFLKKFLKTDFNQLIEARWLKPIGASVLTGLGLFFARGFIGNWALPAKISVGLVWSVFFYFFLLFLMGERELIHKLTRRFRKK